MIVSISIHCDAGNECAVVHTIQQENLHAIVAMATIRNCAYNGLESFLLTLSLLVIGASLSEPLLVRSTPALSVYIYIYYHVSYDRHLPRAHAYDLNSKAARGVYIERTSDVEVQRSQRS